MKREIVKLVLQNGFFLIGFMFITLGTILIALDGYYWIIPLMMAIEAFFFWMFYKQAEREFNARDKNNEVDKN